MPGTMNAERSESQVQVCCDNLDVVGDDGAELVVDAGAGVAAGLLVPLVVVELADLAVAESAVAAWSRSEDVAIL